MLKDFNNVKYFLDPYPHMFMDNSLDYDFAKELQKEILDIPIEKFDRYDNPFEQKFTLRDKFSYPEKLNSLFTYLESNEFIETLSSYVGNKLYKDDTRNFNGVHIYNNGDKLDIHLDAGIHPKNNIKKYLTLGIYLSLNWREEYGCHLEIWKGDKDKLHQPKRKMRQTYLFLYNLKLCFR